MYIRSFFTGITCGVCGGPPPVPHFLQSVINTGKLFIFETKKTLIYLLIYLTLKWPSIVKLNLKI